MAPSPRKASDIKKKYDDVFIEIEKGFDTTSENIMGKFDELIVNYGNKTDEINQKTSSMGKTSSFPG
jgi:hypothetical protein